MHKLFTTINRRINNWQEDNKQASEHPNGTKQTGGTNNKQCLITRALEEATGMTQLRR